MGLLGGLSSPCNLMKSTSVTMAPFSHACMVILHLVSDTGLQTQLGWGGVNAVPRAIGTILFTLSSSLFFFLEQEYNLEHDEPLASTERPQLRRRETVVRRRTTQIPSDRQ